MWCTPEFLPLFAEMSYCLFFKSMEMCVTYRDWSISRVDLRAHDEDFNAKIAHIGIQASHVNTDFSIILKLCKTYTCRWSSSKQSFVSVTHNSSLELNPKFHVWYWLELGAVQCHCLTVCCNDYIVMLKFMFQTVNTQKNGIIAKQNFGIPFGANIKYINMTLLRNEWYCHFKVHIMFLSFTPRALEDLNTNHYLFQDPACVQINLRINLRSVINIADECFVG